MITINNLIKKFGSFTALDIPHLNFRQGEMVGLLGNNGAGKTTLFRLMLDLLKADEGQVLTADGTDIAKSEEWKNYTAAYIDESFLVEYLSPEEFFYLVGKFNSLTEEEVRHRLEPFHAFMTDELYGKKKLIRELSAGNKQKVGIVSAMLRHPRLLILDEPFNYLDPSSQNKMKQLLRHFNQSQGTTIIVSSHNLQHTIEISNRVVLLEKGHVIDDLNNVNKAAEERLENYFNILMEGEV